MSGVGGWSAEQVLAWVSSTGLPFADEVASKFQAEEIDGETLLGYNRHELKEDLKMPAKKFNKLWAQVERLVEAEEGEPPEPMSSSLPGMDTKEATRLLTELNTATEKHTGVEAAVQAVVDAGGYGMISVLAYIVPAGLYKCAPAATTTAPYMRRLRPRGTPESEDQHQRNARRTTPVSRSRALVATLVLLSAVSVVLERGAQFYIRGIVPGISRRINRTSHGTMHIPTTMCNEKASRGPKEYYDELGPQLDSGTAQNAWAQYSLWKATAVEITGTLMANDVLTCGATNLCAIGILSSALPDFAEHIVVLEDLMRQRREMELSAVVGVVPIVFLDVARSQNSAVFPAAFASLRPPTLVIWNLKPDQFGALEGDFTVENSAQLLINVIKDVELDLAR